MDVEHGQQPRHLDPRLLAVAAPRRHLRRDVCPGRIAAKDAHAQEVLSRVEHLKGKGLTEPLGQRRGLSLAQLLHGDDVDVAPGQHRAQALGVAIGPQEIRRHHAERGALDGGVPGQDERAVLGAERQQWQDQERARQPAAPQADQ